MSLYIRFYIKCISEISVVKLTQFLYTGNQFKAYRHEEKLVHGKQCFDKTRIYS